MEVAEMTKHRWEGSVKSFGNHIDPEKEEHLKRLKTEIEGKVKRTLKLAKGINSNKDGNLKKKSEIIHLIEDFQQQYESLYFLYDDLRGEVKNNVIDDGSSTSPSESEAYYSPVETTLRSIDNISHFDNQEHEMPDVEDTTYGSESQEFNEILRDLTTDEEKIANMRQRLAQMRDLDGVVANLKTEVETLSTQKRILEEQVQFKLNETIQMQDKISRLEACVLEQEENKQDYLSKISGLVEQTNNLQLEVNTLRLQKGETKERSDQVKGLMKQIGSLQKDFKLNEQIMKTNHESYQSETEKQELQGKIFKLQKSLSEKENELSVQQKRYKASQKDLSAQIESLNGKVKKQKNRLEALQNERKSLLVELEALRKDKDQYHKELEKEKQESSIIKSQMEKKNTELTDKIADQQKTLLELGEAMSKLKVEYDKAQMIKISPDSKSNYNLVERKMEEMAEEFRKQFEDKYRILSRRIRVAEQLHVENKEWYLKTKDAYEQENKELKERFTDVKDMSVKANDMLISLDSVSLKFEECTAHFLNRISKSSCELKFAKDWAVRKNRAISHVKDDLDCLLSQLDDKEAEILIFREKVWKSENKVRELEKMMKEKEDGMLGFQEEKREAIRQLCVWIDYHRSRSDYYKKMLSEMNRRITRKRS